MLHHSRDTLSFVMHYIIKRDSSESMMMRAGLQDQNKKLPWPFPLCNDIGLAAFQVQIISHGGPQRATE